jgi:hypothetical protein
MNDTPATVNDRYRDMIMKRSPADRLAMACRMFATAKALAIAGIRHQKVGQTNAEIQRLVFLRFYSDDLTEERRKGILDAFSDNL